MSDNKDAYRKRARELYERDGEIEIDDNALVSAGDDPGAYVQAWVWVEMYRCKFCDKHFMQSDVRFHQYQPVCDECWDDRLKTTE